MLPLHYVLATMETASKEVIELLLKKNPEGIRSKADDGTTPLHLICPIRASREVIELLIETCPEMLLEEDKLGENPLDESRYYETYIG